MNTARDLLACVLALVDNDQLDHLPALVPQIREALAPPRRQERTTVCVRYGCGLPARVGRLCEAHLWERRARSRDRRVSS